MQFFTGGPYLTPLYQHCQKTCDGLLGMCSELSIYAVNMASGIENVQVLGVVWFYDRRGMKIAIFSLCFQQARGSQERVKDHDKIKSLAI